MATCFLAISIGRILRFFVSVKSSSRKTIKIDPSGELFQAFLGTTVEKLRIIILQPVLCRDMNMAGEQAA